MAAADPILLRAGALRKTWHFDGDVTARLEMARRPVAAFGSSTNRNPIRRSDCTENVANGRATKKPTPVFRGRLLI